MADKTKFKLTSNLLLAVYPDSDLLGIPRGLSAAGLLADVQSGCGDTLFSFVVREAIEEDKFVDIQELVHRLQKGVNDLAAVAYMLAAVAEATEGDDTESQDTQKLPDKKKKKGKRK